MVRFQTQGPGVSLQTPNWDAEYKRQTPFKQIVGLYNMWQSLSPDTRNWIAGLFGGGKDEILDAETDPRDPILDEVVNPDAGTLERFGDDDWREVGNIQYTGEESDKYTPKNPLEVDVGSTDPWGIGAISTEPAKSKARRDIYPDSLSMKDTVGPSYYDGTTPNALSTRQVTKSMAGGNQSVLDSWPSNDNKTSRTDLFDPTGYWSILL